MKRHLKTTCLSLIFALTLNLVGCGVDDGNIGEANVDATLSPQLSISEPKASDETVPGYISTEIATPDWIKSFGKSEAVGDIFYIVAYTVNNTLAIAGYDTINDNWQRYDLSIEDSIYPGVSLFSATEDSLWVVLRENYTQAEVEAKDYSRTLDYSLIYMDLDTGNQVFTHIDWKSDQDSYFLALIALDQSRALLSDGDTTYLIDPNAQILETPQLQIMGDGLHAMVAGEIYVNSFYGLARLDRDTLQYENPIEEIMDQSIYSSSREDILTTKDSILYSVNLSTGEQTEIFSWMDVSLSYSNLFGWNGLENSKGEIFHLTDRLIKVTKGEVPVKQTLVLACLGDASDQDYDIANNSYVCSSKLMDAILKFNNSDPEYRIEVKPFIYHDETERNKILMEISTGNEIDLIDTSLLPEGAVDRKFLVDLLPYIDADENISREDFIPTLFNSMMKNGGLYEYVDKYTMLTMYTHPDLTDDDSWTAEKIESLIEEYADLKCPSGQEQLIRLFSWAATAEFMDQTNGTSHFDDPTFVEWLSLLKILTASTEEYDSRTFLFNISFDFIRDIGYTTRSAMRGDYFAVGFPSASETGSYFMKLGKPGIIGSLGHLSDELNMYTLGSATALGILASSDNRDGAWRFLRTFILCEEEPSLRMGIPVLKESFELAVEYELSRDLSQENLPYDTFNQEDATALRELVYNTSKIVCTDEAVMDVMTTAITAYLGGKGTAEEAAQQIQSRMSIYMSEQYG